MSEVSSSRIKVKYKKIGKIVESPMDGLVLLVEGRKHQPCHCHPETCNHKNGMMNTWTEKVLYIEDIDDDFDVGDTVKYKELKNGTAIVFPLKSKKRI